jgi:hypothetical protein
VGGSSLAGFRGDVLGLPRIVVPTFASGQIVIGNSQSYEAYEEVIGLLSVVEPSILGVTVAYGGYLAYGALAGTGLVPITAPTGFVPITPTPWGADEGDGDEVQAEAANGGNGGAKRANGGNGGTGK